jgi:endonuclease/exonuclease/phosphatase family metal-dependent hydrolase
LKILILIFAFTLTSISGCSLFTTPLSTQQRTSDIEVQHVLAVDNPVSDYKVAQPTLRVLSLNMAHGRKDSFTQFFVGEAEFHQNLADIVEFLKREDADIVALQEADSSSRWSGNFDHVALIAREAGYPWYTHAKHLDNMFATYGTAVLSRYPITQGYKIDFNPTPPTTRKGFTLAEIEWTPGGATTEKLLIDVVSVHLDFSRRSKRIEQIADMNEILEQRTNPAIVLGDFNSTWSEGDRELQALAKSKQLKTHRPDANHLYTYFEERFDWILISKEFEFCDYYTAPDILSDHLAVIGDVVPLPGKLQMTGCG